MEPDSPDQHGPRRRPEPKHVPVGRRKPVEPTAAGVAAERTTGRLKELAHELNNLIDGAVRYVALARRGLAESIEHERDGEAAAMRQLASAESALMRMASLVRGAMAPGSGSLIERFSEPRPLVEAMIHACDALRPLADEREIELFLEFSPRLVLTEAGPLYTVISNAIRNSIEAIGQGGRVEIVAELVEGGEGDPVLQVDILDDGPGPLEEMGDPFAFGVSTKGGSKGVGLALCREIVDELGGRISLSARRSSGERRGGHLTLRVPLAVLKT